MGRIHGKRFLLDDSRFVGTLFLVPTFLYMILLVGFPFVLAVAFSFSDATVGNTSLDFVGLENYRNVWRNDLFRQVFMNTVTLTLISQIFIILFSNVLATIFTQEFTAKWFFRFLFILPWATPVSLAVSGWLWMFDSKYSPIDFALVQLGLLGPNSILGPSNNLFWLGQPVLAKISVIFVQVWRMTPLATVILLAGLSSIATDILDQTKVDGASFLRTLLRIKLPLILPITAISVLFSVIQMFGDMTVVYILTRGGPIDYTRVLGLYAFQIGIDGGNLAQGAAMVLFAFPILLALALVMLRIASRTEVR